MVILPENPPIVYFAFVMSLIIQIIGVIIFQKITKVNPVSDTLGYTPILVNTFGHIIYGLILGLWLTL